jgi:hypothetical protein
MTGTKVSTSMREIADSLFDLLDHNMNMGMNLLQTFTQSGADMASKFPFSKDFLKSTGKRSCCEIPSPCWMPRELNPACSHVCPGGTATILFCITNCGLGQQTITAEADQGATVTPSSVQLGPLMRGSVAVNFAVPATSNDGELTEILVRVHGCKSYFMRWAVRTAKRGCACCLEVNLDDCPDLIHHWYDHFYCQRPCIPAREVPGK